MTHILPTLYKKTSTGAIQFWDIAVEPTAVLPEDGLIITRYGQVGTEKPQETVDRISSGKNLGKKNATTAYEQAVLEANAKHEKQRKKGYVDSQHAAEAGEVDAVVQGGLLPMLAHSYAEHAGKITFPAYGQPKLDGVRCIAILENGKCTLWSRQRNPITSSPHIIEEIESRFGGRDLMLDGELYNHEMRDNFELLVSLIRQERPHPDHKMIQYHVYDIPIDSTNSVRYEMLDEFFETEFEHLKRVPTFLIQEEWEVPYSLKSMRDMGYEGLMLRNIEALYVNKRSYDLQKIKEFDDAEFEIIGIKEGRGKLQGHVGAFICRTAAGAEFEAKLAGNLDRLEEYWNDHSLWDGKRLTVRFQGYTKKDNVPRFPVGVTIRDYEG